MHCKLIPRQASLAQIWFVQRVIKNLLGLSKEGEKKGLLWAQLFVVGRASLARELDSEPVHDT